MTEPTNRRRAILREWYGEVLRLYFLGDTHVLSASCNEDAISKVASIIERDTYGMVVGLGDYIESISYTDKRFDPSELAQPIMPEHLSNPFYEGALRFVKLFEATRGKWLCLIAGNHEERAAHITNFDPLPIIAERLGTTYLGGSDCGGWARIQLVRNEHRINALDLFLSHGSGGGELRGGDVLRLQRLLMRKDADIVAVGHGHKPGTFVETSEGIGQNLFETNRMRWGVECFPLIGKHGYIARKGGNAPPIGYAVAEIKRRDIGPAEISISLNSIE